MLEMGDLVRVGVDHQALEPPDIAVGGSETQPVCAPAPRCMLVSPSTARETVGGRSHVPPPRRQTPCRGPCCRPKDRYSTSHADPLRFAIIAALSLPNQRKTPGPIFRPAPALCRLRPRCSPSSLFASARLTHV